MEFAQLIDHILVYTSIALQFYVQMFIYSNSVEFAQLIDHILVYTSIALQFYVQMFI